MKRGGESEAILSAAAHLASRASSLCPDPGKDGSCFPNPLEGPEEAFLVEDGARRVLFANARFCELSGLGGTPEELVGRDASALVGEPPDGGHNLDGRSVLPGDGRILEGGCAPIVVEGERRGRLWRYRDVTERERSAAAPPKGEDLVRGAMGALGEGVVVADLQGVVIDASPGVAGLTGLSRGEMVGRRMLEVLPPEGAGGVFPPAGVAGRYGARLGQDGEAVWVEVGVAPNCDGSGRVIGTIGVVSDVTGRRRAEEALKEGEARFRTVFEQSAVGIAISDPHRRLLETNPAYGELLGYTSEELYGKDISELSHPDDEPADRELNRKLLAGGPDRYGKDKRLLRKDGGVVWVHVTGSVVRDEGGAPRLIVAMVQDISERKRAEEKLSRSEEKFYRFVEHAADAFFVHDPSGRIVEVNQRACESLGYTRAELLELSVFDIEEGLSPQGLAQVWEGMVPGLPVTLDGTHRRRDGTTFPVEVRLGSFASEGRELMLALVRDVTERRRAEEKQRESEGRFRQLFEGSVDTLLVHDEEGRIVDCNSEACRSLGYSRKELLSLHLKDFVVDLLSEEEKKLRGGETFWARALRGEPGRTVNFHQNYHRRKDGTTFPVEVGIGSIEYAGKRYVFASARDVTERRDLERRLAHQAFHDGLTGLPNRTLLLDRLDHALAATRRSGDSVAILFLDLDNFKVINDSLGHGAGDELLVMVGRRLEGCVRPNDTVARLGGDEFTVLLEGISGGGEVERVVERIMGALAAPFEVGGGEVFVTASVGVVPDARGLGRGPDDLMRDADLAMYRAKEGGKARYAVYEEAMRLKAKERLGVERDLRVALSDGDGLEVHYQPEFSLAGGELVGVEALVRWRHPERGLVGPDDFVPIAEETGLILQLGRVVLLKACRSAVRWRDARPPEADQILLGVNVSAYQLKDPGFVEEVAGVLESTGLEPDALVLEITESVVMDEPEKNAKKLAELKALGVRIAIDDFGTGYSSLAYLKRFPVDYLKIDRSFLEGLGHVLEDTVLVSGMLGLARSLGLAVVAEGIETVDQLSQLGELGCDLGQGFHFSKALPEREATNLILHGHPGPSA